MEIHAPIPEIKVAVCRTVLKHIAVAGLDVDKTTTAVQDEVLSCCNRVPNSPHCTFRDVDKV